MESSGPGSFEVLLEDGRIRRCHQDHLRERSVAEESEVSQLTPDVIVPTTDSTDAGTPVDTAVPLQTPPGAEPSSQPSTTPETLSNERPSESNEQEPVLNERQYLSA